MQAGTPLPELLEDGSAYCVFGAETLLKRIAELEKQIEGAKRNEDIEYIHRLRVASRRLRTALTVFEECLPKKQIKAWKKAIKNLTTSCGEARDEDVLIAFLENYLTGLEPRAAAGVEYLIRIQKARRLLMQSDVVRVLDSLQASGVLVDLSDTYRTIRGGRGNENINIKTLSTYTRASNRIVARLDELLALSRFVHDKSAIAKHHELRIAAKRLRYTMEIFSAIYKGGLKDQIELMKQFQDVLGEMHDYYVWSQDLKAQRQQIPADARYGLNRLVLHLGKQRVSRYRDFVSLWDETKAQGVFAGIRELTDTGPNGEIIRQLLNSERKVALISDIHGNLDALKAVVKDAEKSGLEVFLNVGDAVGFGIYPSQVVQALRSPAFLSVLGNVDLEILEALRLGKPSDGDNAEKFSIKELSPSDVAYLQSLPRELRFEIAGTRVLLTHGSPDSIDEHIYPDSSEERLKEIAAKAEADVVVTGHTHLQMNRSVDGVTFINPGSVGRPVSGEPKAEYAVLSFSPLRVEFRKVAYDIEALADEMRKKALPESHVQVLLRAVNLNTVEKQEKSLARKALWKRRSTIRKVRDIAKNYFPDESHADQDRKLALMMFSRTKRMQSLGPKERYWLECAAILHDIGRSRGDKRHHRHSLGLILNDPALPFTQRERYIIGSIARYHRKALPNRKHFNLRPLSRTEREKVAVLSSILRVADALDYSHRSVVKKVNLKSLADRMALECFFSGQHYLEDQSVKKRKDLFEKVFKKNLAIVWKTQQITDNVTPPDASATSKTPLIADNSNPMT
jgi:putative phosphoesterase